jgi:ribonuclease P protein component
VQTADFKRALAAPTRSRSAHFAVHYVNSGPSTPWIQRPEAVLPSLATELSTGDAPDIPLPVDDLPAAAVQGLWLGTVVPKRHARRAVTRTLIKRQMRAMLELHAANLPQGLWVLRLRSPFARDVFKSAASEALRLAARTELDQVLVRAALPASVQTAARGPRSPRVVG